MQRATRGLTVYSSLMLIWLLASLPAVGQDSVATDAPVPPVVELDTNAPHASVYADDLLLGRASQRYFRLPVGARTLRLVLAGRDNWSIPPIQTTVGVSTEDTSTVRLDFPYYYRLESTPFSASVYRSSSDELSIGKTPLEITLEKPLTEAIIIKLADHWPEEIEPGQEIWNVHAVRLRPIGPLDSTTPVVTLGESRARKKWIDYAALGTAAVAGVVAVHYKFKADRRYDTYRESGDPALRTDIKRYDVYSGVALGVMQAGLGLFAIRLVLR